MTRRPNGLGHTALSFIAGLAATIAAVSCSSPGPNDGTNTNWLCNSDADCTKLGTSAVCTGGVCKLHGANAGARGDAGTELPACTWPANLDPIDASSRDTCHAARALLACGPGGIQGGCTSNDPTRCPGPAETISPCKNECGANEYAAACGGPGLSPIPDPPAGCRLATAISAGTAYYCCPCGG